jgi:hypothetical protein
MKTVKYYTVTTNVLFYAKITIRTLTKKISRTDRVRNKVLQRVNGMINSLHTMRKERLSILVTSCVGTAFQNNVLQERCWVGQK